MSITSTTITEKVLATLCGIALFLLLFSDSWIIALIILAIALALAMYSEYTIPANPPTVGIPTVWGKRQNKIVKERLTFVAAPFEGFVEVDRSLKNKDITYKGVRCSEPAPVADPPAPVDPAAPPAPTPPKRSRKKVVPSKRRSGGSVAVKVGITWEPDDRHVARLNQYIDACLEPKVTNILSDITGEVIREIAAERTWEEVALAKELLSALVIVRVTGLQPTEKVKRDKKGNALRNPQDPNTPKYQIEGLIDPNTKIEDLPKEEIEHFLDSILKDGPADVRGLGIRIRRINVVEVQPEGKLAEDAELNAREKQQRSGEQMDFDTERGLIRAYMDDANKLPDGTILKPGDVGYVSYQMAAEWVRVNRRRANENIVRSSGNLLADAASMLTQHNGGTKH